MESLKSIESLERPFAMPKELSNEIVARDGDAEIVYRACAWDFCMRSGELEGLASFSKVRRQKEVVRERQGFFRPRYVEQVVVREERVWAFYTVDVNGYLRRKTFVWLFAHDIKMAVDRNYGYRAPLVDQAANAGIVLREELLNTVFGPIDAQLVKVYAEIMQHPAYVAGR